jgi:hypothetical protein
MSINCRRENIFLYLFQIITSPTKLLEYAWSTFKHYCTQRILQSPTKPSCNPTHIDVFTTSLKPLLRRVCLFGYTAVLHRVLKWFGVEQNKVTWMWMRGPGNHLNHLTELRIKIQFQRNKAHSPCKSVFILRIIPNTHIPRAT